MTSPAIKPELELDCFLEIEGVSPAHAEEVALALAEELEAWLSTSQAVEQGEVESAREVAKQLRLLGWLINDCAPDGGDDSVTALGADRKKLLVELELLTARVNEMLLPPAASGVRRRITPPAGIELAALWGADDDEQTVVKKSKWQQ
ncbi:MAG: hypothetical protein JNK04_02820, partial [Myxococcales bacterium]|nr:hypothetical protein [Myxococcales bacterium]